MTLEEENAALRAEIDRLTRLCDFLRNESSVGFRHGMVRSSHTKPVNPSEPQRSLLDL